jgi:hypothetical protein
MKKKHLGREKRLLEFLQRKIALSLLAFDHVVERTSAIFCTKKYFARLMDRRCLEVQPIDNDPLTHLLIYRHCHGRLPPPHFYHPWA